jgi:hypothetical protein
MRFWFFDQLPRADWQSERQRYQDILAQDGGIYRLLQPRGLIDHATVKRSMELFAWGTCERGRWRSRYRAF